MMRRQEATSTSSTRRLFHSGDIYIPIDVTVEILKKIPTKSLMRFQCVSKLWSSIISRRRDFIDSIITRSLTQPPRDAYFIALKRFSDCYVTLSSNDKESVLMPGAFHHYHRGLVCCSTSRKVFIYNPTTRQSFFLPEMEIMQISKFFLGYDPIENQYKVLSLTMHNVCNGHNDGDVVVETCYCLGQSCQVFTLGETTSKKWRTIQGIRPYQFPFPGGVCINGRIYYQARNKEIDSTFTNIMISFDVRSEEFYHHVDAPKTMMYAGSSSPINYQGKLGFVRCEDGVLEIWVMETQGWSKIFFNEMNDSFSDGGYSKDVTGGGEIVFIRSFYSSGDKLNVLYYDMKRTLRDMLTSKAFIPRKKEGFHKGEAMKRRHEAISTSPTRKLLHGGDINIPLDITVEILKILPTKSIVRFQCVSKEWASIIGRRRDFIDWIITRSLTQPPRVAYVIASKSFTECYLTLSSFNEKESVLVPGEFQHYLRGLVCYSNSGKVTIFNLTTRQSFNLPETKTMQMSTYFLGYDPIENQYKVLSSFQVFTLGETTTKKWKTIQGVGSHLPLPGGVCINGTIYYQAGTTEWNATSLYKLMSFNVRSEELYQVDAPKIFMDQRSSLINYQGKLGFVCCAKGVEIWVMETQGWSMVLSDEMKGSDQWRSMGVNRGGEIVLANLATNKSHELLRVLYYDLKRNSKRHEVEVVYLKKRNNVISIWTVPDFVENTMRLY